MELNPARTLAWLQDLEQRIERLERQRSTEFAAIDDLQEAQVSTQEQADADTAAVAKVSADLVAAQGTLQTELDALQASINAGQPVSLAGLTAAIQTLDPAVQAVGALKPTPAAPPPPPPAPGV